MRKQGNTERVFFFSSVDGSLREKSRVSRTRFRMEMIVKNVGDPSNSEPNVSLGIRSELFFPIRFIGKRTIFRGRETIDFSLDN